MTGTATATEDRQYTDAETGFQYLRARYYDPATGQFLSRDPIEAQTRSAYGYVGGNPLNGTDASGLCWGPTCVVEAAVKGGGALVGTVAGGVRGAAGAVARNVTVDNALAVGGIAVSVALIAGTGGVAAAPYLIGAGLAISGAQTYRACRPGVDADCIIQGASMAFSVGGAGIDIASSRLAQSTGIVEAMARTYGANSVILRDPLRHFSMATGVVGIGLDGYGLYQGIHRTSAGTQLC